MTGPVLSMSDAARADVRSVGGKASQLARLARRGHVVPPFFVIGSQVFSAIRADPRVRDLERGLAAGGADDPSSAELRSRVESAKVDRDVWRRIAGARRALGSTSIAVRSSGAVEDGAATSLAGQLDTVLDVRDDRELDLAIRRVWSSAYAPRAVAYRRLRGMRADDLDLAVIVQVQVAADVSGVLFTVDPADAEGLAISAVRGLGADLVGGRVEGHTYRVDRTTLERLEAPHDGGILSERDVSRLAKLGLRLERELGAPQDVEWAIAGGRIFILQARPITTSAAPRARRTVWDNANIVESFPGLTLPLTYSLARESYAAVYRQAAELAGISARLLDEHDADLQRMIGLIRGRVYYRLDSWYALLSLVPGSAHNKRYMEQMMGVRETLAWRDPARFRPRPLDVVRLLTLVGRMTLLALTIGPRVHRFERMVDDVCGQHEGMDLRSRDAGELVDRYEDLKWTIRRRWQAPILNDFLTMLFFGLMRRLVERWGPADATGLVGDLLRGADLPSIEPARRVALIAAIVRRDAELRALFGSHSDAQLAALVSAGTLPPALADPIRAYLDRFGHRCVQELKLEQPGLRDDPAALFASVRAYLDRPDIDLGRSAERDRQARAAAEGRVGAHLAGPLGLPGPRLLVLRWVIARARRHVRDREQMRFARARVFGLARELFTALGLRLADAGHLDDPRDVFHLTVDEVCGVARGTSTGADLRSLVDVRRREYEGYRSEPPLPDRFQTSGDPAVEMSPGARGPANVPIEGELRGLPCCAGKARGPANLVVSVRDHALRAGDILVARETDPGWVTLFPLAAGILIERGSPLSHSAIVARELGIPTIVGIRGLTATLATGTLVEMDGGTGVVAVVR